MMRRRGPGEYLGDSSGGRAANAKWGEKARKPMHQKLSVRLFLKKSVVV